MIPLFALPALLATASPTMDARSEKVIDLFVRVCLQGEARFERGDVERVNPGSIPGPLVSMTWARRGDFYKVRRPVQAWIAITGESEDHRYSRVCRVAAKFVDVRTAANRVRAHLREPPLPGGARLGEYEEDYLDGGAEFSIWHARWQDQVVLESYVLTPAAAARARRKHGE